MKKISIFLLLILTVTIALLFSACTPLHRDLFGDWQYDEVYHWQPFIECNWGIHDIEPELEFHSDADGDTLCDVCPCLIKHEHIVDDWHIEEDCHYKPTLCTWYCCDIDYSPMPHEDSDGDLFCDDCGYQMMVADHGQQIK